MPARPLAPDQIEKIQEAVDRLGGINQAADELGMTWATVKKYAKKEVRKDAVRPAKANKGTTLPVAVHEETGLPDPVEDKWDKFPIESTGQGLALMDLHLPYHDRPTIELSVKDAKDRGAKWVLINGDALDSHEISRHDKDPRAPRYLKEVEVARQFFRWLREQFPRARIVYKAGNHEDRLESYLMRHAPALFGLEGVNLPSFLHLDELGIDWVGDKRIVTAGKLHIVHGHEYPGGTSAVNPARGLYLKAKYVSLCGHHHRSSEHNDKDIRGKLETAWSVGCACWLHPKYFPLNQWNHGYALIELAQDGGFQMTNRRVLNGKAA